MLEPEFQTQAPQDALVSVTDEAQTRLVRALDDTPDAPRGLRLIFQGYG